MGTGDRYPHLKCMHCSHEFDYDHVFQRCNECDSEWSDIIYDYEFLKSHEWILRDEYSLWRYANLLPLKNPKNIISMKEGWTPISKLEYFGKKFGHDQLYIKEESRNPTGSFKARQASLVTSVLRENGINDLVVCSTGNVSMAFAAYCAKANINLTVFIPEMVPVLKENTTRFYGATVIRSDRSYYDTRQMAKEYACKNNLLYDPGADNFANRESKKTIALEIAEQFDWGVPDWYVQAVNGGPGPMGVAKGFNELYKMGLIDKIPKIACVQSDKCSPMVDSFLKNLEYAEAVVAKTKIVTLSYESPGYSFRVLSDVVRSSKGTMIKVDEDRAFRLIEEMAKKEGRLIAPASAVAVEGTLRMIENGTIGKHEKVVINITGDGVYCEEIVF